MAKSNAVRKSVEIAPEFPAEGRPIPTSAIPAPGTADKAAKVAAAAAAFAAAVRPVKLASSVRLEKETSTRAGWSGLLSWGLLTVPVKTYKGQESTAAVEFNMIHTKCGSKLSQKMVCPCCNVDVPRNSPEQGKGYEYEKGKFVTVTPAELASLAATPDKKMEVMQFVPAGDIDPLYVEASDYIAPDKGGETAFAIFRASMVEKGVVGIAKRVKGGKEETLVIRPHGKIGMLVQFLYYDWEVRGFDKWDAAGTIAVDPAMVELAGNLIDSMTEAFDPKTMVDTYSQSLRQLVDSKIPESGVAAPVVEQKADQCSIGDMMADLKASLAARAKGKK